MTSPTVEQIAAARKMAHMHERIAKKYDTDISGTDWGDLIIITAAYEEAIEELRKSLDDIDKHATGSFGDSQDNARAVLTKAKEKEG